MRLLTLTAALLLQAGTVHGILAQSRGTAESAQARLFLRYLDAVAEHRDAQPLVDSLMQSPGTALVIAQQNLSRRVSAAEYREVLLAFAEGRAPTLDYDRNDPRAVKGVAGLMNDVLPELRWAVGARTQLASNLAAIAELNVSARATALALENLPERVPLRMPLFVVMGGRAGAAATDGGIYYDVLVTSFRSATHSVDAKQVMEFFAHELHHVGLDQIIDRRQKQLRLNPSTERAFSLLSGLVMEGAASYLINGHRDLAAMRRDPTTNAAGTDQEHFKLVERVLNGVLAENWSEAQYNEAMAQFVGNTLHITGAVMLDAIWHKDGRAGVMAVLRDPRVLLARYNAAVASDSASFQFPPALVQRVSHLGD